MAKTAAVKAHSRYDVHPGVAMVQKWVDDLKEKTSCSLEEWIALVKREGPKDEKSRREWLKIKHKLGTNSTWWSGPMERTGRTIRSEERRVGKGVEVGGGRITRKKTDHERER